MTSPYSRPLDPSDLVNVDVTVYTSLKPPKSASPHARPIKMHGDTSKTFLLPAVDNAGRELTECANEALERGISVCGPGVPFKEIGRAIE